MKIKTIGETDKASEAAAYVDLPLASCIGAAVLGSLAATFLGAGFYLFVRSIVA